MCARAPKSVPQECGKHTCGVRFDTKMGDMAIMEPVCLMICFLGPPADPGHPSQGTWSPLKRFKIIGLEARKSAESYSCTNKPNAQVQMLWLDRWGHNCPDPNEIVAPSAGGEARKRK